MSNNDENINKPTPRKFDLSAFEKEIRIKRLKKIRDFVLAFLFIISLIPAVLKTWYFINDFFEDRFYTFNLTVAPIFTLLFCVAIFSLLCFWVIRLKVFEESAKRGSGFYIVCFIKSGDLEIPFTFYKGFRTPEQAKRYLKDLVDLELDSHRWINDREVVGMLSKSNLQPVASVKYFIHHFDK